MDIVTVKSKFQIVIPRNVRERAHVEIGHLLEAGVENGRIVFTLKSLVDRHVADGLRDAKARRTRGPHATADEAIAALEARARRAVKRRR
ncbi:MAG: AbrB/MazE/SpoVT family DNA-binding domain-containing protein [Bryobacteraceae bacterium]